MTNISKRKLSASELKKIFDQFAAIISKLDKASSHPFLTGMLTESEQVMLAKRLAAILMIHNGYSTYRVWTALNISSSTAKQYALNYEQGVYNKFLKSLSKPRSSLLKDVENFLENIIAPMGKDRWRYLKGMK